MNVETILKTKGRDVVTMRPEATLAAAAKELHRRGIGAIVVTDDKGGVSGILSERDVVHTLAKSGPESLANPIAEVMTHRVHTCRLADTINDLMALMTAQRIRHLPVVEQGKLCGIVSIGDVVKYRLEEVEFEAGALREYVATAG
ncbi:inosine-5-monophosphate dehydrogenase [Hypericibacter adhaerens]|uniref:Inosine-5-monophosphate dehydrogenase n=1 Tax=Hypericibacter adhaerens TaxID=2602016 RepID=A0A5J6N672_9PROT|nr:CBS domain-containing protein [Hypericibacter adhaerens]QEX24130.1 inosine-5-monophosphate dehydrogenase [Hypericibacter adhaerens]